MSLLLKFVAKLTVMEPPDVTAFPAASSRVTVMTDETVFVKRDWLVPAVKTSCEAGPVMVNVVVARCVPCMKRPLGSEYPRSSPYSRR